VSLLSRISGMLDSFHKIEFEEKDRYGAGGEDEVEELIRRGGLAYVRNPLAPHPSKPGVFLESDFLVHVNGGLFAVEVKKLIGRIEYDDSEHRYVRQVNKAGSLRRRCVRQAPVQSASEDQQLCRQAKRLPASRRPAVPTGVHRRGRGIRADGRYLGHSRSGGAHLYN